MDTIEFVVTRSPLAAPRRPVIGVDGPVPGADLCFDHHSTGELVNLLAIPDHVPMPAVLATTMVDTDAVTSAVAVLLRASGHHAALDRQWPILFEASHYCDLLLPSGRHPDSELAGLGLHLWLKHHGFAVAEVAAWTNGELRPAHGRGSRPAPSLATQGRVFRALAIALVAAVRRAELPCDWRYLERLPVMEAVARRAIQRVAGGVTVLRLDDYVDPIALYRVVETDLTLLAGATRANGRVRYGLGVHPRAYARRNLRPVLTALSAREPGWGGRAVAGGSPILDGSRIRESEIIELLDRLSRTGPPSSRAHLSAAAKPRVLGDEGRQDDFAKNDARRP